MTVTIRPDLEQALRDSPLMDTFNSIDELVNAALAQFLILDDFEPGELDALLEEGMRSAAAGEFVEQEEVERRIRELKAARQGQ